MPPRSTLRQLPANLKATIDNWLKKDQATIEEIVDYLQSQGHEVSKSAVGRYKQYLDKLGENMRLGDEITAMFGRELGDAAIQGKQGRLLIEMVRALAIKLVLKMQGKEDIKAKDIADFGKGLAELGRALRLDQDFELKVRQQVTAEVKAAAVEAVEASASEAGVSRAGIENIKARVLGVEVPA